MRIELNDEAACLRRKASDANKTGLPYVVPNPSNESSPNAAECLDCSEHHVDCSCCPGEG